MDKNEEKKLWRIQMETYDIMEMVAFMKWCESKEFKTTAISLFPVVLFYINEGGCRGDKGKLQRLGF